MSKQIKKDVPQALLDIFNSVDWDAIPGPMQSLMLKHLGAYVKENFPLKGATNNGWVVARLAAKAANIFK